METGYLGFAGTKAYHPGQPHREPEESPKSPPKRAPRDFGGEELIQAVESRSVAPKTCNR